MRINHWVLLLMVGFAAQISLAEEPQPTTVVENALTAIGRREVLTAISSLEMRGTVRFSGLIGSYRGWESFPDKWRMVMNLTVAHVERGFDGQQRWERRGDQIATVSDDNPLEFRQIPVFRSLLDYAAGEIEAQTVGQETLDERQALAVEFQRTGAEPHTLYFDLQTWLPMRATETFQTPRGKVSVTILYSDYREVEDGVQLPFSIAVSGAGQPYEFGIESYLINRALPEEVFAPAFGEALQVPYAITLESIPQRPYKVDDGILRASKTESWTLFILVDEAFDRPVQVHEARVRLLAGGQTIESLTFTAGALQHRSDSRFAYAGRKQLFDIRHDFSRPKALGINGLAYELDLRISKDEFVTQTLEVPLSRYEQKSELIFPLRGRFMVIRGSDFNEPHKKEWSQQHALDIAGLGDHYEQLMSGEATENASYAGWDREVLAPAGGRVVFARNDLADNPIAGQVDLATISASGNRLQAVFGNHLVIDHENGEFSVLGHLRQGSVVVAAGDRVEQGQVIGRLGNSGDSSSPHLHYHLMAGPTYFLTDGLPSRFDNVALELFKGSQRPIPVASPKRGIPLLAE